MDERKGRAAAAERGIASTGTPGILDAAAEGGLLDSVTAIDSLRETSFYVAPALLERLLDRETTRRHQPSRLPDGP